MHSMVNTPEELVQKILPMSLAKPAYNEIRPKRFIRLLQSNHATADETDEQGLSRRSPLIVAFGDSVTAGWCEGNLFFEPEVRQMLMESGPPMEHITDIEIVYHEQLRKMLAQKYERISPSVVNSGISGDTITGMYHRVERDVLRYDPHLILLNGSLNWKEDTAAYAEWYRRVLERLMGETDAEIVVMTPNLIIPALRGDLDRRVQVLLEQADRYGLCVCDTYSLWVRLEQTGIDITQILSNGVNHPTAFGHRLYANELMKLF